MDKNATFHFQVLLQHCERLTLENLVMRTLLNNCAGFEWAIFDDGVADPKQIAKAHKMFHEVYEAVNADEESFYAQLRKLGQGGAKQRPN